MSEQQSNWTYAGKAAGDKQTFSYNVKITYELTPEATAARDKHVMAYLRKFGEYYKTPFATDPVALCDLWAEAWLQGHGEAHREAARTKDLAAEPKRKSK